MILVPSSIRVGVGETNSSATHTLVVPPIYASDLLKDYHLEVEKLLKSGRITFPDVKLQWNSVAHGRDVWNY